MINMRKERRLKQWLRGESRWEFFAILKILLLLYLLLTGMSVLYFPLQPYLLYKLVLHEFLIK